MKMEEFMMKLKNKINEFFCDLALEKVAYKFFSGLFVLFMIIFVVFLYSAAFLSLSAATGSSVIAVIICVAATILIYLLGSFFEI